MSRRRRPLAAVSAAFLLAAALGGCRPREEAAPEAARPAAAVPAVACQDDGGALQLGCPAFPNTTPEAQPQWDTFAWNSFIAANWPAVDPAANNEQRGFPDLSQSFATAGNDALLVWETFKEKREVFLQGSTASPGPWNQAPMYGPVGEDIPPCSGSPAPPAPVAGGPYRTGAQGQPLAPNKKPGPPPSLSNSVTGYSAETCVDDVYRKITPGGDLTPCPTGSIHVKSAWIPLQDEDPADYHTAQAAFFKTENGKTCVAHATFGLVGLHIIQRIHQGSSADANADPLGGTFVFATWEHAGNDEAGFTYANFFPGQPFEGPPERGFYPLPSAALPVARKFPILESTQAVNAAVHAAIAAVAPDSVWLNYQLVGVQFQAVDVNAPPPAQPAFPVGPNDPTGIGQPFYLANLVIETNDGLQQFQGLPPLAAPISQFQNVITKNGTLQFNRQTPNVAYFGQGYNMGGCMGCHGVSEVKGYSFSFVLLGGQQGAGVDTQQSFEVPPPPR